MPGRIKRTRPARGGLIIENIARGLAGGTSSRAFRRAGERIGKKALDNIQREIVRFAKNRTGALERSYRVRVEAKRGTLVTYVTSPKPYARILDRGGTIVPKRAQALTVPLNAAARGVRARTMGGLHRRGSVLFRGNTAMYALKKSVTIKPRYYLRKAARRTRTDIEAILQSTLRDLSLGVSRL